MWAFIVYMFIPSILHPGLCFRVNGHLRPRLTCSVCAADSTASDRIRKRKHESHISALKNPSRLCGTAKKNPKKHKLQVFSEAEQLKPRGWFLDVLAAVTCLNHDISYCPAVSPDTHFFLVWITSQYLCCCSQWKKKPPKFKTKEAAFEITNDRNYCPKENMTKTNSEDCTYHKFAPCFPTTSIMLRLMSTNLSISNAWEWGRCKAGLYLCQVFDSCIMLQISYEKCNAKL